MKIPRCKGTRDLLPGDMAKFRYIESVFRDKCLQSGYREVRTPTLEYLHLFTSAGTLTPEMLGRVYSFLDWDGWSGERVVLRPDGTIPVTRLYGEHLMGTSPAKLFYVENIFTFEGTGEDARERWECGVELIGSSGYIADVELVMLAVSVLKQLNFDNIEVRLSHAGLIEALLKEVGSAELLQKVLEGYSDALNEVQGNKPELAKQLGLLLSLKGKSKGFLENLRAILPAIGTTFDELTRVTELLTALGCNYNIHLASGLGFEYYTGTIFQLYCMGQKLGGGGRYDELIPLLSDNSTPAAGFALYVDHIMDLMSSFKPMEAVNEAVLIKPVSGSIDNVKSCFELCGLLHEAGFIAELDFGRNDESRCRWILVASGDLFDLSDRYNDKKFHKLTGKEAFEKLEESR